jgi:anti-sigma regulatory factor (Ser/Thr protein kinase)
MGKPLLGDRGRRATHGLQISLDGRVSHQVLALQPGPGAPRLAREALRAWLAGDDLRQLDAEILIVASELVTNAVLHARTTLELSYEADDSNIEVGVRDLDVRPWRPTLSPPAPVATRTSWPSLSLGGRGLAIVAAMADEWGVTETQDGKQVWARWLATKRKTL